MIEGSVTHPPPLSTGPGNPTGRIGEISKQVKEVNHGF